MVGAYCIEMFSIALSKHSKSKVFVAYTKDSLPIIAAVPHTPY